jgi:2-oxoglutarate ferredoxin oxidoreductase subunit alpha
MFNHRVTIRIVGESGEGIVSTGEILSRILQQMGQQLMTFRTYPAEIKGGQCLFQLRFSQQPLHTPGHDPEILLCFDEKSYFEHGLKKMDGILIYNSDDTAPENHRPQLALGVPFDTIARDQVGAVQSKNMVALGAISFLLNLDREVMQQLARQWFASKGEKIIESNTRALLSGWDYLQATYDYQHPPVVKGDTEETLLLSGNQALVLGALAAGCRFFAGYPITPASGILESMIKELPRFGGIGLQTEDEMAAIGSVIGASFAGKKAMTATSGPGFSLMQEMIGLASMAEIPAVIVDSQRAGPSTGMPTKMEQGDLLMAIHGSHGEGPRVVIAPANVQDCFALTVTAFNLAEALRTPVIVLTDLALSQRTASFPVRLFDQTEIIERKPWQPNGEAYLPYEITDGGVNPMAIPGQEGGMFVPTGLEHDVHGHPNYSPEMHSRMTAKRHRKLQKAFEFHKGYDLFRNKKKREEIGVISWGSTEGPILEAIELLEEKGLQIPLLQLKLLNPLPESAIKAFAALVKKIVVPEHNYIGQLAGMIEAIIHRPVIRVNKVEGVPFTSAELAEKVCNQGVVV